MLNAIRRPIGLALAVLCTAAASAVCVVMLRPTAAARPAGHHTPAPHPVAYVRAPRLDPGDWATLKHVAAMRTMALAPGRTAMYRSFAAYMGLSGLTSLHPARPGRCATAVSYLYDNLLDLHDAYPGEDWKPLRRLIKTQPSLSACSPRRAPQLAYAS
jgi:hypothetical protein